MNTVLFIVSTVGLGLFCSIPGVLTGKILSRKGIVRDRTILVISSDIFGFFLARLVVPDAPLIYIVVIFLIISPLGVHDYDLWTTFRSGKWWWLKSKDKREPWFSLSTSIALSVGIGFVFMGLVFGSWMLITYLLH